MPDADVDPPADRPVLTPESPHRTVDAPWSDPRGGPHDEDGRADVLPLGPTDRDAEFTAFMAAAQPVLGRMAWLLCGDVHQAQELVQHALVRTYVAWPRARERDPEAYARRVLANARIDTWRRRRREVLTAPDEVPDAPRSSQEASSVARDQLVRALLQLPARRRSVVVLRYLMDLPETQVADDLGISVGTVKSTASRGLDQLRLILRTDTDTDPTRRS